MVPTFTLRGFFISRSRSCELNFCVQCYQIRYWDRRSNTGMIWLWYRQTLRRDRDPGICLIDWWVLFYEWVKWKRKNVICKVLLRGQAVILRSGNAYMRIRIFLLPTCMYPSHVTNKNDKFWTCMWIILQGLMLFP